MANNPTSVSALNTTRPSYTDDKSSVTKTVTTQVAADKVSVDASMDGSNAGKAVVVLKVNSDGKSTASVDSRNVVQLVATGSGTDMWMTMPMSASDPNNWTVNVQVKGGSGYKFVKGNGGGGH